MLKANLNKSPWQKKSSKKRLLPLPRRKSQLHSSPRTKWLEWCQVWCPWCQWCPWCLRCPNLNLLSQCRWSSKTFTTSRLSSCSNKPFSSTTNRWCRCICCSSQTPPASQPLISRTPWWIWWCRWVKACLASPRRTYNNPTSQAQRTEDSPCLLQCWPTRQSKCERGESERALLKTHEHTQRLVNHSM